MLIHIKGGVSGYEPENIARMFFPGASLTAKYVRGEDLVFAAAGRCRLAAGVRRAGCCVPMFYIRCHRPYGQTPRAVAYCLFVSMVACHRRAVPQFLHIITPLPA